ncbi:MAG: IclR family transcriptional regulator [Chloroflexi bacterium]|nr:IclR family transcriptional regulator [Chloroflexota bacterium]
MTDLVPAVDRALRILNAFKGGQAEFGVSELSRELALHKSTTHGIVSTLCYYNLLEQDPASHKYRLGGALIELGNLARRHREVREVAHAYLLELTRTTGETALLGIFENDGITIIDRAEPLDAVKVSAPIGQRVPFCAGCFGRAFLAWMDEPEVERLLQSPGLRRFTATSITDPTAYKASLAPVLQQGYAVDSAEEYLQGVWAVSAPILGSEGVAAALTVVGFSGRMTPDRKQATVRATYEAARQVSQRIGGPRVEG